jgi:nucleotide-binding universal stress UspA family protein
MTSHDPPQGTTAPRSEPGPVILAALGDDEVDQTVAALALQTAHLWPDTSVHLAHVLDVPTVARSAVAAPSFEWSYPGLDDLRQQGLAYVEGFVRSTGEALGRPVEGHLLAGAPVDEILGLANRLRANLLVVGSRDVGRLTRFLVGSKADVLVHEAPCAVLIARAPRHPARAPRGEEICPDCLRAEADSFGAALRCPRHALAYGRTHGRFGAAERGTP